MSLASRQSRKPWVPKSNKEPDTRTDYTFEFELAADIPQGWDKRQTRPAHSPEEAKRLITIGANKRRGRIPLLTPIKLRPIPS